MRATTAVRNRRTRRSSETQAVDRALTAKERALAVLLRPVLGRLLHDYLRRQVRPTQVQRVSATGSNPLRVLVTGAGIAVGYGATEGETGFPGRLAAALAVELGRGVIVESRAHASVRLEHTVAMIGAIGAATFDVVIWSPTLEEIFRGGTARWTRRLAEVVTHVQATGRRNVRTVLMGVPVPTGEHLLQRVGAVHADEVNRRITEVAARFARVEYLAVPEKQIESRDTALFDPSYQAAVVANIASLLGDRQRRATAIARAALPANDDHRGWRDRSAASIEDDSGPDGASNASSVPSS